MSKEMPALLRVASGWAGALLVSPAAMAQAGAEPRSPDVEEANYHLFNPQPRHLWRELSADRPDTTESPLTVPPGAVQLEMSFVDYTRDGGSEMWMFGAANLKLGLLQNVDLQFVLDSWIHSHPDGAVSERGIGDSEIRLKVNLWGNDGEQGSALAVMPYIKLPTARNDLGNGQVEGGLIVPFATVLGQGIGLGLMGQVDVVYDDTDDDYDLDFVHTAVLGFELSERAGWYVEGVGIAGSDAGYRAFAGTGFTWAMRPDVILDAGINLGLEGAVDDVNIFTGITIRF